MWKVVQNMLKSSKSVRISVQYNIRHKLYLCLADWFVSWEQGKKIANNIRAGCIKKVDFS